MLKRGVLAVILVATGIPMLTTVDSALLGTLLVAVGLALLGVASFPRRSRG